MAITVELLFKEQVRGHVSLERWVTRNEKGAVVFEKAVDRTNFKALALLLLANRIGKCCPESEATTAGRCLVSKRTLGKGQSWAGALYRLGSRKSEDAQAKWLRCVVGEATKIIGTAPSQIPRVYLKDAPSTVEVRLDGRIVTDSHALLALARETLLGDDGCESYFEPELPTPASGIPQTSIELRARLVSRPALYRHMIDVLRTCREGTVRLMSFQPRNPLLEHLSEIEHWHDELKCAAKAPSSSIAIRRLVAIWEPDKIKWLESEIDAFQGTRFSMRLFPRHLDADGLLAPLPMQMHVIGTKAFLGGAKDDLALPDIDTHGLVVDLRRDERDGSLAYYTDWYDKYWNHAGLVPDFELMDAGVPNKDALRRLKTKVCCEWIRARTAAIRDDLEFSKFNSDLMYWLDRVEGWWVDPPHASEAVPYRRQTLATGPCVEVMLAAWSDQACWPHGHGGAHGRVYVLAGEAEVTSYEFMPGEARLRAIGTERLARGDSDDVRPETIHATRSVGAQPLRTLHVYFEPDGIGKPFTIFDMERRLFGERSAGIAYRPPARECATWRCFALEGNER